MTVATSFTLNAAVLMVYDTIGINFGTTASADPGATWNDLSGVGLAGGGSSSLGAGTLSNTTGGTVDGVGFTLANNSSITTIALGVAGSVGDGLLIDHASVWADGFRADGIGTSTFTYTFTGLNDNLTYDFSTGVGNGNSNFANDVEVGGFSQWIRPNLAGQDFRQWTDLVTDGSGNLVITQTERNGQDRIAIVGMTLTAVPEPSSTALLGLGGLALALRRRRA